MVFPMAPNTRKMAAQLPTHSSTCPSKKCSQSISTPSVQPTKKAKPLKAKPRAAQCPSTPLCTPIELFTSSPPLPQSAQPDAEDNDEVEDEVEDDDVEELPVEPVRFMSVWKAVNGKEILPGTQSAMFDSNTIYLTAIEAWRDKLLMDLSPRKFRIQQLEAIASYEKARAGDLCQQQVNNYGDLRRAVEIVEEWHLTWPSRSLRLDFILSLIEEKEVVPAIPMPSQHIGERFGGRRTATQAQLSDLPTLLATEEAAGNHVPKLADKWSCSNKHCGNYPKTCWQNKRLEDSPDNVLDHYSVSQENMAWWNKEILNGHSTIDQPSQNIIVNLVNWKQMHKKNQKEAQPVIREKDDSIDNLIKVLLVKELKSQPQLPVYHSPYPIGEQPRNSSPVRSETDPVELLGIFFDWLAEQPGFNSDQQRETLELIKRKLMEDMWNIDTLKVSKREGEGMTNAIWEAYEFKIGMLARIRGSISAFKLSRQ